MPVFEVELSDGRVFEVESDQAPSEQDVMAALPTLGSTQPTSGMGRDPELQGSGGASATVGAARGIPAAGRSVARFAANHPAATQKTLGALFSTGAGAAGAAVGGVPGAVVGASIRGVTPTQAGIRTAAGQMAGEAPEVARTAGRAVAVSNYGKEMGLKVKPTGLISTGEASRAFDNYADAQGLKAPRVLDQYGKVVYGPEAVPQPKAPSKAGRLMTGGAKGIGKALAAVSGPMGMTDFAQTVEPERRDIGVMGIGASQPTPQGAELDQLNQRNISAMHARQAEQAQQQQQIRARIMAMFGM